MRCLLPRSLLEKGFFPSTSSTNGGNDTNGEDRVPNFSWSGHRKIPSYINKLVFPENFLTALRTADIQEEQLSEITHLLEEVLLLSLSPSWRLEHPYLRKETPFSSLLLIFLQIISIEKLLPFSRSLLNIEWNCCSFYWRFLSLKTIDNHQRQKWELLCGKCVGIRELCNCLLISFRQSKQSCYLININNIDTYTNTLLRYAR